MGFYVFLLFLILTHSSFDPGIRVEQTLFRFEPHPQSQLTVVLPGPHLKLHGFAQELIAHQVPACGMLALLTFLFLFDVLDLWQRM